MPIGVGSSLHFLVGPLIAFVVLALLALFLRWAVGNGTDSEPVPPADDGLRTRIGTLSQR